MTKTNDVMQPFDNQSQFLLYTSSSGKIKVNTILKDETIWLTQKSIAELFGVSKSTISEHMANIYESGELVKGATVRNFRTVQEEAGRSVSRNLECYNLDAIISVGYRVNSVQATQFRIWATQTLKEYIIKGFILNDERFKSGNSMQYFDELQERIREIRLSERFFYQKIKDIYTTSIDYDSHDEKTIQFFKIVQNKLLWAISSQTAEELVYRRIDATLPLLGMQSYDKDGSTRIKKSDVSIAKNYLNEDELKLLGLLVEQYLAFAETMAQQHKPMYMKDWIERLDVILQLNGRELLTNAGNITHEMAILKSEAELEKYKLVQQSREKEQNLKEIEADIEGLKKNYK